MYKYIFIYLFISPFITISWAITTSPPRHRQAVHLLSISKQFDRAVQLCAEHDVQITEDMAERMTPEKTLGTEGCWGWVDLHAPLLGQ